MMDSVTDEQRAVKQMEVGPGMPAHNYHNSASPIQLL